jgi:hypothetical protein
MVNNDTIVIIYSYIWLMMINVVGGDWKCG